MKKTLMYERLTGLYPFFRESMEEGKGSEQRELRFILDMVKRSERPIKTIIDLGGGIGTHAHELQKKGYTVAVFDQSKKVLAEARKKSSKLRTIHGTFETISLNETFDVAMCLWSTFPYILIEKGRKHFFNWLKNHVRHLIILDEANFYRYLKMKEFHKIYEPVEDGKYKFVLTRDWIINKDKLRKTSYVYTITNKRTGDMKLIQDEEVQQYLSANEIQTHLGKQWNAWGLFGDFKQTSTFDKQSSPRLISVFERRRSITKP